MALEPPGTALRRMIVTLAVALCAMAPALAAEDAAEVHALGAGETIDREMAGGETHRFRLTADAGSYVRFFLQPRGLEMNLTLSGPDGTPLAEAIAVAEEAKPTTRSFITDAAGSYELAVSCPSDASMRGTYTVGVAEWRLATPADTGRVAAERALEAGDRLDRSRQADDAPRAIAKYEEALALSTAADDGAARADAYRRIGSVRGRISDYPGAMDAFRRALDLQRATGDRAGEAAIQIELGGTLNDMSAFPEAREHLQQAIDLHVGSRRLEAVALNNMGASYRRAGDARRARDYYRRSLALARAVGYRSDIAANTNNLALTSQIIGEYQESLELYGQALALWRALGQRENEGVTLGNIGLTYRALGDDARALEMYRQSYELRRSAGDRIGEALALGNMGAQYHRLGQREKALASIEESLAIRRSINDRAGIAVGLRDKGELEMAGGALDRASDLFGESLALSRAIGNRSGEALAIESLAGIGSRKGDHVGARDRYLEALPLMKESGERRREAATLLGLAQAERALGNTVEALTRIESAIEIIELLRSRVTSTDLRASFQAANRAYYQFHIDLLMQLERERPQAGFAAKALQVSERARSRSLLDLLTEAQIDFRQGADAGLVESERTLIARINANDNRRRQLPGGEPGQARRAALEKEVGELLATYQQVQADIRTRSPQYAALTQPQPLDLEEIRARVLDPDTLLLEYKLGADRSYLWAVAADAFASFELPGESEIDRAARRVYDLLLASSDRMAPGETIRQKSRRVAGARADYDRAAAALSRMVVGPVAPLLGKKRLVVVSEGALQYVPFAALPKPTAEGTATGAPLIVDHEVVSLPSASVLSLLRADQQGRPPGDPSVAVLADPVFSAEDPRLRAREKGGDALLAAAETRGTFASLERSARDAGVTGFRRLRFTRDEAQAITALMPGQGMLTALDFRASRATAMSPDLGRHRIVHLATHGLLDSAHPELSGIVLSLVDEQGRPQDGFLRLHEIYGLQLRADLVVLSACQTALGQEVKGEGLVGLTRGFMYAGAPRIVASLWNVEDRATAELMRHFYGAMSKEAMRPAQALRAAQMALRAEKRWAAPYYWAAFTLQGDWN